jgi:hypothetical protein
MNVDSRSAARLANRRLERLRDGRVLYTLTHAWSDGTRQLLFQPLELLEKLPVLVPRPRVNLLLYHGVWRRMPAGARTRAYPPPAAVPETSGSTPPPAGAPAPAVGCSVAARERDNGSSGCDDGGGTHGARATTPPLLDVGRPPAPDLRYRRARLLAMRRATPPDRDDRGSCRRHAHSPPPRSPDRPPGSLQTRRVEREHREPHHEDDRGPLAHPQTTCRCCGSSESTPVGAEPSRRAARRERCAPGALPSLGSYGVTLMSSRRTAFSSTTRMFPTPAA